MSRSKFQQRLAALSLAALGVAVPAFAGQFAVKEKPKAAPESAREATEEAEGAAEEVAEQAAEDAAATAERAAESVTDAADAAASDVTDAAAQVGDAAANAADAAAPAAAGTTEASAPGAGRVIEATAAPQQPASSTAASAASAGAQPAPQPAAAAQAATAAPQANTAAESNAASNGYAAAAADLSQQLRDAVEELDALRQRIADEKIPMSRTLSELEGELIDVRAEYQQTQRTLDSRTLDLSNLRSEIKTRSDEASYLSNLLSEYIRNFESRLHIAELARYESSLEAAKLAPENRELSEQEVFAAQAALLDVSIDRLEDALGGTRFEGSAVDPGGILEHGWFAIVGPTALFVADNGDDVGTAEQRLGSLEPSIIEFAREETKAAAAAFVTNGEGTMPVDTTLGNAHKIEATQESLLEHVQKGGPVMIPIFAMAALALLVALIKWLGLTLMRKPSRKRVNQLMSSVEQGDEENAEALAARMKGPLGRMLAAGVEHIREPRELVEEVMYERVLTARLKLNRMLPFIAICAAAAPLMGLLGTVTGIINTFKMITVFGSGDVKSLSGGISEALITTKFGLIVAIPSLLLHAFLSRKVRGVIGQMETAAVTFVNKLSIARGRRRAGATAGGEAGESAPDPQLVRDQVNEILGEMFGPLVDDDRREALAAGGNSNSFRD